MIDEVSIKMVQAAAKSIGLLHDWSPGCGSAVHLTAPAAKAIYWNPLRSNEDAYGLMVSGRIAIVITGDATFATAPSGPVCEERHDGDPIKATRVAITRAAATAWKE
jgi:hypothetical protein